MLISVPSPDANSWASLDYIKNTWLSDPYKDPLLYTDDEIEKAAIAATIQLDFEYANKFTGTLYDESNATSLPRIGLRDYRNLEIKDMTTFPTEAAKAVAEQAWYIIENPTDPENISISTVKSQKMDGVGSKENFSPAQQRSAQYNPKLAPKAVKWLEPLTGIISSRYVNYWERG